MVDIQQDKARMGGISLKAVFRPQFIGESDKHKVVSLFQGAEKQKNIDDDSDQAAEESDADQKLQGQLFEYEFVLDGNKKQPNLPLMIKTDRRRLQ